MSDAMGYATAATIRCHGNASNSNSNSNSTSRTYRGGGLWRCVPTLPKAVSRLAAVSAPAARTLNQQREISDERST
jgi:hypothetical protein